MDRIGIADHTLYNGVLQKQAYCCLQYRHTSGVRGLHAVSHAELGNADVPACHVMHVWKEAARMIMQLQSTSSAIRQNVDVCIN